jgi:hypothetical protein
MFETLGIVKHEHRRIFLGKIKSGIEDKENVKLYNLLEIIELYPNRISAPAYEMLVELAVKTLLERKMLIKIENIV